MAKHRMCRESVVQPLDQSYRIIPLTQGKVAKVDVEDFEYLSQFNWSSVRWKKNSTAPYAQRWEPTTKRIVFMHREVLKASTRNIHVDHINHDTLDNRKENLRLCDMTQNNRNQVRRSDNTSGYKGVSWNKRKRRWEVRVGCKRVGYFTELIEAAMAYDEEAIKQFEQFAHLNFPPKQKEQEHYAPAP